MTRDPNRINSCLEILRRVWNKNPDLRLGQIVCNASRDRDPFYIEDDLLMDLMEKVASLGEDAGLNIHAENHRIVNRTTRRLKRAEPNPESLKTCEESHPGFAVAEAIQRAVYL